MSDPRVSFVSSVTGQDATAVLDRLGGTDIHVHCGRGVLGTAAGQTLCRQLSSLLARLYDRVALHGDEGAVGAGGLPGAGLPVLAELRRALPELRPPAPRAPSGRAVHVGLGLDVPPCEVYLGAGNWSARFSMVAPQEVTASQTTLGGLAAGILGAAEVFKLLFAGELPGLYRPEAYAVSLLDHSLAGGDGPELPASVEIDATLFGVGSIGMGFLQAAVQVPSLVGRLILVDNGRLDERNPVKYSLIDWEAGQRGEYKAPWAARRVRALGAGRLDARGVVATATTYVEGLAHDYRLPLALCAVDTYEARWHVQDTLPEVVINAGIDGTLAEVSVHGFGDGPCLGCLAVGHALESWDAQPLASRTGLPPARVHELLRGNLGLDAGDLETMRAAAVLPAEVIAGLPSYAGQPLLSLWQRAAYAESAVHLGGAAPMRVSSAFVSAYAGLLLLAEAVKRSVPELRPHQVDNSYRQELLGAPAHDILRRERDATGHCLCHSGFRRQVYREKYGAPQVAG